MAFAQSPHFSFGFAGDRCIGLDLAADRYLELAPDAAIALRRLAAGMDAASAGPGISELTGQRWILADGTQPVAPASPAPLAASVLEMPRFGSPYRISVLKVTWRLLAARTALTMLGLGRTVGRYRSKAMVRPRLRGDALVALAQEYQRARFAIPLRRACLPDSLAMARVLRSHGAAVEIVFGVRLQPFGAHAWVQSGETLLSDNLATVMDFAPVLVL